MSSQVSAYNGGTLAVSLVTCTVGNVVGSLSGVQRELIEGCLLGDGAMRCKTNALLEVNHAFSQKAYVD